MGKPIVRHPCLRCGKIFSAKPKKDDLGNWYVEQYCQACRNKQEMARQLVKVNQGPRVRIAAKKVDLKSEVRDLVWAENRYPELVKKLREEKELDTKEVLEYNPTDDENGQGKKEKA